MNNITTSTDTTGGAAFISRAAEQPQAGGVRFALPAELTHGPLDVGIERVEEGGGPPMHIHHDMDEYLVVLSGSLRCRLGERDVDLEAGDAAFMPRGLEHTFTNVHAQPCECAWVFNPGGFHEFLAALDDAATFDPQVVGPIAERHGHELTGPPLAVLLGL